MTDDDTSGATLELDAEVADNPELSNQGDEGDDGEQNLGKRLKDTQAKLHEVTQERSKEKQELLERLARLEGMVTATRQQEAPPDNPMAFLDDPGLKEKFYEDAETPIGAIKRAVQEIGKVFPARDQALLNQVEKMIAEKLEGFTSRADPAIKETMAALRKDPDFAKMDDATLTVFARKLKRKAREFPGEVGGSRASGGYGDAASTEVEKMAEVWAKKMYGED